MTARRGVFWPLLLIALGVLFLMGNFGLISGVSWRAILSLWPLLLVLIGLDIAFARRWPLPTLAAEILVIVAGLALAATSSTVGFFGFPTGGGNGVADVSAPRGGATAMSVTVNGGAGHYRVSGGATDLVDAHSANPDLRLRTSGPAARPDLRVDQVGPEGLFRNTGQVDIDVHLASDVPTSFTMNSGAGEFDVDLSDVRVTDVRMNTGASTLRLVLPKPSHVGLLFDPHRASAKQADRPGQDEQRQRRRANKARCENQLWVAALGSQNDTGDHSSQDQPQNGDELGNEQERTICRLLPVRLLPVRRRR